MSNLYWPGIIEPEHNLRYENDGYPPDIPGKIVYKVNYPNECYGYGYKKGSGKCPYCGNF